MQKKPNKLCLYVENNLCSRKISEWPKKNMPTEILTRADTCNSQKKNITNGNGVTSKLKTMRRERKKRKKYLPRPNETNRPKKVNEKKSIS